MSNPINIFRDSVATISELPQNGNIIGDARIALNVQHVYVWNGTNWVNKGSALPYIHFTTDASLSENSDSETPSEKAIKAYIDAHAGGGGSAQYILLTNTVPSGQVGGVPVYNTWSNFPLNTKNTDTGSIATLNGDSSISLPAGTYEIYISQALGTNFASYSTQVFNITGSTMLIPGMSASAGAGGSTSVECQGAFILSVPSTIAWQYFSPGGQSDDLGAACGNPGINEVYTFVFIKKVA
jgi:hypothetical protein